MRCSRAAGNAHFRSINPGTSEYLVMPYHPQVGMHMCAHVPAQEYLTNHQTQLYTSGFHSACTTGTPRNPWQADSPVTQFLCLYTEAVACILHTTVYTQTYLQAHVQFHVHKHRGKTDTHVHTQLYRHTQRTDIPAETHTHTPHSTLPGTKPAEADAHP